MRKLVKTCNPCWRRKVHSWLRQSFRNGFQHTQLPPQEVRPRCLQLQKVQLAVATELCRYITFFSVRLSLVPFKMLLTALAALFVWLQSVWDPNVPNSTYPVVDIGFTRYLGAQNTTSG